MQQVGVQGSRPPGAGSVTSSTRMALFSGLSVFRTAVIVGIAAVVAYRVRSASFKRTVLTGDGGLFEDSVDNSSERCKLLRHLQSSHLHRIACVESHAIKRWLRCSTRCVMHAWPCMAPPLDTKA